jgi:hypothetical protein
MNKQTINASVLAVCFIFLLCAFNTGCSTDAQVVSRNLSMEAGMFNLNRRVIFYNGITGEYILTIEGRCQVEHGAKLAVTCKTGPEAYKKHYLGLSDNVTYFSEQLEGSDVSRYRYKVIFKPSVIIPDVDLSARL